MTVIQKYKKTAKHAAEYAGEHAEDTSLFDQAWRQAKAQFPGKSYKDDEDPSEDDVGFMQKAHNVLYGSKDDKKGSACLVTHIFTRKKEKEHQYQYAK